MCQPGWKVKQLPKVDYFAPILDNSTRAQHVKAQFARQDVTAKTDSAGECFDPLLVLAFRILIDFFSQPHISERIISENSDLRVNVVAVLVSVDRDVR